MCGIAGAFAIDGLSGPPLDRVVLERMTEIIRHRGPDDRGFAQGPGMSLGARRLSIIDIEGGHQPLSNESGEVWAAQNGEIYNHAELRNELRAEGHVFRSRCDTEVLPHLYERDGAAALRALARQVRRGGLGCSRAARHPGARPPGRQAAVLRGGRRPRGLRLGAEVRDRQRARLRRARSGGARRIPDAGLRARTHDAAQGCPEAHAGRVPDRGRRQDPQRALLALSGSRSRFHAQRRRMGRTSRVGARRRRARADDERRAGRRAAERWAGFLARRRTDGAPRRSSREDVLRRLRRRRKGE